MIAAARGGWSDRQILDAIYAATGSQQITFKLDVVRDGIRLRSIPGTGEVSLNRFADIQRIARLELYEPLDWLRDEIKPYMLLRMNDGISSQSIIVQTCAERDALDFTCAEWDALDFTCAELDAGVITAAKRTVRYAEFPLGLFIPSTPTRTSVDGQDVWSVEAYDHTIILEEDCITEPLYFAQGTTYLSAIQSILVSAGIEVVFVQDFSNLALPAERIFEIGLNKRSIINTLLSEINFNSIYCNADGVFIISKYVEPSAASVSGRYLANEMSIIGRDTESSIDYYKAPNVFIAICDNPDLNESYVSVRVNDNPASPFSTIQRGRRITSELYRPDAIASQEALDAYIRRIAFEVTNERYEQLIFETGLNPLHERAEVLELSHPDATGIFVESGWTIPLDHEGMMRHEVRRLLLL